MLPTLHDPVVSMQITQGKPTKLTDLRLLDSRRMLSDRIMINDRCRTNGISLSLVQITSGRPLDYSQKHERMFIAPFRYLGLIDRSFLLILSTTHFQLFLKG